MKTDTETVTDIPTVKQAAGKAAAETIGHIEGDDEGPVVIALGGLHGNEPASVEALEQMCEELHAYDEVFAGTFLGINGNLRALESGVRFVDEDLNRIWTEEIISEVRSSTYNQLKTVERRSLKKIMEFVDPYLKSSLDRKVIFVDLHSFSAPGGMFAITARDDRHIRAVSRLDVPLIFGIEEDLEGTAVKYAQEHGCIGFAFEGGQHVDPETVYNQKAALYVLLETLGCLSFDEVPHMKEYHDHLLHKTKELPHVVELKYRHTFQPEDQFRMRPGFRNFQYVHEGEELADDKDGPIKARCDGHILMPLYQKLGSDGFFIVESR